jgi:hypothetical protein
MSRKKPKKIISTLSSWNKSKNIYAACGLTVLTALSVLNISYYYSQQYKAFSKQLVLGTTSTTDSRLDYWYSVAVEHPNYIIAWLEIAKLESDRGNSIAVLNAINFAEAIDPNFEELLAIKKKLGL